MTSVTVNTPRRSSGPQAINEFNGWLKQQPWYQQFFAQIGQDLNRVRLSRGQQSQLEDVMQRNGVRLANGVHIDNAGNLNEKNRTVRNAAIIAGTAAGAYFAGPALIGALGSGAPAGAGSIGAVGGAGGMGAAGTVGTIAGAGAASSGIGMGSVLAASLSPAIGMAGNYFANRAASNSARDAAQMQTDSVNYAADLESKSAEDQLAFLKEQDALTRKERAETEAKNFALYQEEQGYTRGLDSRRYNNLAPYREMGAGSIGQLSRPIKNIPQAGSLGARMRAR